MKCIVFVFIVNNGIKNQKFNFLDKLCDIQKNVKEQNCLYQKDLRLLFWPFFYKMRMWSLKSIEPNKLITLLISNKKEFNHFFKSKSSDIVLQK